MNPNYGDALVLFSGGQDSTTCLLWALHEHQFGRVHVVSFDYNQRHQVELEQADKILRLLDEEGYPPIVHHRLSLPALSTLAAAALTSPDVTVADIATGESGNVYAALRGLPSTFVPGRNTLLIGTAAALAAKLDARHIVTGICAMDRAGYPDCRAEFASAIETTLRIGLDWPELTLHTPVLYATKSQTWQIAAQVAGTFGVELVRWHSHTCYEGDRSIKHEWGYGCGQCPACDTRADGWAAFELVAA